MVIHSGTCAHCKHLFISSASLPWMEVNFLNQKPCILSWPGTFQFDILFSVFLSTSMYIFILGLFSTPSSSLVIFFIHSPCFFGCHIFSPKSFGLFYIRLLVCFGVTPSQILIEFSFVVLECPVLSVLFYPLSISFNHPFFGQYFPVYFLKLYCYFPRDICSFFPLISTPLFLIIRACLCSFFICVSSLISHPCLDCFFMLFEGILIFSQTNLLLHRLIHLSQLYYSSVCKVVCDLFFPFLSQMFSIL